MPLRVQLLGILLPCSGVVTIHKFSGHFGLAGEMVSLE